MVHFTAAVDLASPVQEEDLEGRYGRPARGGGQDNSQERMKWMGGGVEGWRQFSFIPLTLFRGDESCLASMSGLWREKEGQLSMAG